MFVRVCVCVYVCDAGRIQVSEETYQLLADRSGNWESTGGIEVKGTCT